MRITDSNISMVSNRTYRQGGTNAQSAGLDTAALGLGMNKQATVHQTGGDFFSRSGNSEESFFLPGYTRDALGIGKLSGYDPSAEMPFLRSMMAGNIFSRLQQASMMGYSQITTSYFEQETTSFSASGQIQTEDGQTIDFNIDVTMTRSFMQYTQISMPNLFGAFMDPIVINTGSPITSMSDQKFLFDLNADGEEEYISMPQGGCGLLSLDKDGNGKIDDGSELFGALSGDGFADLKEYDSDGNGWIDENDEIFDKLKVWYKDETGRDVLMNLKDADIGAIFLGNVATEFSLMSRYMSTDAMIRSTGFFLRENGGAGTVQHVDIVAQTKEEYEKAQEELLAGAEGAKSNEDLNGSVLTIPISSAIHRNSSTTKRDQTRECEDKDNEAIKNFDKIQERNRIARERMEKRIEARRRKKKDFLEKELENLRAKREDEKARYEALFGVATPDTEEVIADDTAAIDSLAVQAVI
ncbi:MAG: hypothetical protein E7241_08290 [Lachnospiraceae bacterium]|jgi:hypothetical protein|nr:hypothetical protein [Lachnospiraceae bacterium]